MNKTILFLVILFLGLFTPNVSKTQDFRFIDSCRLDYKTDIDTILTDNDKLYYVYRDFDTCTFWVVEDNSLEPKNILTAIDMNVLYLQNDSLYLVIERNDSIIVLFIDCIDFTIRELTSFRKYNGIKVDIIKYVISLNNKIYFKSYWSDIRIWVTDGSAEGTQETGLSFGTYDNFKIQMHLGNKFIFSVGYYPTGKTDLFITDGTKDGTKLIQSYNSKEFNGWLFKVKNIIFTYYETPELGDELYTVNLDSCKLKLFKDFRQGPKSTFYQAFFVLRDSLFIITGNLTQELWKTDGNPENLTKVTDIFLVDISNSTSDPMVKFKERYFFDSEDDLFGIELWVTDGTKYGTYLFHDLSPGVNSSAPMDFYQVGDKMFFSATDGVHGRQLWVTDGTKEGTKMLRGDTTYYDIYPVSKYDYNEMYYYSTSSNNCLYRSDGTQSGTYPLIKSSTCYQPVLCNFITFNKNLYFSNCQVWTTDGTVENTKALSSPDNEFEYKVDTIVKTKNSLYVIVPIPGKISYSRKEIWRIEKPTQVEETKPLVESELMIYPNPAGDYIYANVETHGRASLQIDTSTLTPGIYTLRCGNQTNMFVKE